MNKPLLKPGISEDPNGHTGGHTSGHTGVSLKPEHYEQVLAGNFSASWFEIHTENYMGNGGLPHYYLTKIREAYPLSFHGVGLSLGSGAGLDKAHLDRVKALVDRYNPAMVSEHVAWSVCDNVFHNDLLPVPYTKAALQVLVDNISQMQDRIARQVFIENPSTYLTFKTGDYDEASFMIEAAKQSGAGLLLDVNNVFVSASNHGWDAKDYLNKIPGKMIGEVHMAGHTVRDYKGKTIRIDDHGSHVTDAVWALFEDLMARVGPKPTLIEWDTNVPSFDVLNAEAATAERIMDRYRNVSEDEGFTLRGVRHV